MAEDKLSHMLTQIETTWFMGTMILTWASYSIFLKGKTEMCMKQQEQASLPPRLQAKPLCCGSKLTQCCAAYQNLLIKETGKSVSALPSPWCKLGTCKREKPPRAQLWADWGIRGRHCDSCRPGQMGHLSNHLGHVSLTEVTAPDCCGFLSCSMETLVL